MRRVPEPMRRPDSPGRHARSTRADTGSDGGARGPGGSWGRPTGDPRDHHYQQPSAASGSSARRRPGERAIGGSKAAPRAPVFRFPLQNTQSIDPKHSINKVPIDNMHVWEVWNHLKDWQARGAVHAPDQLRELLKKRPKVPQTLVAAMVRLGVVRTPVPGLEKYVKPLGGSRSESDSQDHHYPQARPGSRAAQPDVDRKRRRSDAPLDPRKRMDI